jgi:hypothetical protein
MTRVLVFTVCSALASAACASGAPAAAVRTEPAVKAPVCGTQPQFFDFQVDQPAVLMSRDISPTPDANAPVFNLVQFVVDTAGVPDPTTFRILRMADSALVRQAYESAPKWRYVPAIYARRKVCQVVQTPVRR